MADQFKPNVYSEYLWNLFKPTFGQFAGQVGSQVGQPNLGMPQAPTMPSMGGVLSGVPMYQLPNAVAPTSQWWNSLAPNIKAGAWAPYEEAANQLGERMGSAGQLGSARGGYSGAAGAAFGDYYADAANNYGMGLWNMSQPGLMADYQSQLQRNMGGYQNLLAERSQDYQNQMNQLNQNYASSMQAWQMPWNAMMNYNNLAPGGAYHSDSGGTINSILGAGTSLLSPIMGGLGFGLGMNLLGSNPYMGTNTLPFMNYGTNAGMYGSPRY